MSPSYNNPASRLYNILKEFQEKASESKQILQVWNELLPGESPLPLVGIRLAKVINLVPQVRAAVVADGDQSFLTSVNEYESLWYEPLFFSRTAGLGPIPSIAPTLLDRHALNALSNIGSTLSRSDRGGLEFTSELLATIRQKTEALLSEVLGATELNVRLRVILADRLHEMISAIDEYQITGPQAVIAATERIVAVSSLENEENKPKASQSFWHGMRWYKALLTLFLAAPTVNQDTSIWYQQLATVVKLAEKAIEARPHM